MPLPTIQSDRGHAVDMPQEPPREGRIAGPDGWLWPVERGRMQHRFAVRERMAEDISALIREFGDVDPIDEHRLIVLGWTEVQLRAHLEAALSRAVALRRRELSDEAA